MVDCRVLIIGFTGPGHFVNLPMSSVDSTILETIGRRLCLSAGSNVETISLVQRDSDR